MKITITGATGFIGQHLIASLVADGHNVTRLSRQKSPSQPCVEIVGPLEKINTQSLPKTDVLIHLAGLAHSKTKLDQSVYQSVNCDLTTHLAKIAAEKGAKLFIFLSTSKVHGEETTAPFTADSPFNPLDIYSETKANAEQELKEIAGSMNIVSIRPPVVYGKNPKANIASLTSACKNNGFLPLPVTQNKRSFLYLGNLCSAINSVIQNPSEGYQGYVLDDGSPVSTEELVNTISSAVNSRPRIVRIPNTLMKSTDYIFNTITNKQPLRPLYSNFEIDSSAFINNYNWVPPYSLSEGIMQSFADNET